MPATTRVMPPIRAVHVVPQASQREHFTRSLEHLANLFGQVGAVSVEGVNLITKTDYTGTTPRSRTTLPGYHAQHRSRALSAVAAVLLHHPGGVLTMRTRRFAIAAGLVVLAGCNFDILNTNQPTLETI